MDEKNVRKSHGHHIPPAKGMGERALLLLGLLSLLTAADEVRHTDAQHRATSDPSEGHAVKAGEGKAGALLVDNGEAELTDLSLCRVSLNNILTCLDSTRSVGRHIRTGLVERTADSEGNTTCCGIVVPRGRLNLLEDIGALIETDNIYFAVVIRGKLHHIAFVMFYALSVDVLVFDGFAILLLQSEFNARKSRVFAIYSVTTNLGDIDAVGIVISRVNDRSALTGTVRVIRVGKLNLILLRLADESLEISLNGIISVEDLGGVELRFR